MGGGKQTTQQTSQSAPWGPAQPHLQGNMRFAQDLTNAGVGAQVNPISTAVPFDTATTEGMLHKDYIARENLSGGLASAGRDMIRSGGMDGNQRSAVGTFDTVRQGMGPSYSEANLAGFASGDNLGQQNPLFRQAMTNAMSDARDQIDMTMSGAGRYGSGSHAGLLSDRLGRIATDAYANQYERDRSAMFGANQAMDAQRNTDIGRRMAAAGEQFNAGQAAFGNLGQAYDYTMRPADTLMQTGAMREGLEANVRQDQIDRFDRAQMAPWENLARANAIFSGTGALGGTRSGTATVPGQNPFATAMGYGMGGLGLLGRLM
jgi:hypothetical protein